MANEKNLINRGATQFRSGEEAVKNGHKGGKASGESRRRKKNTIEAIRAVLAENAGGGLTKLEVIAARVIKRLADEGDIRDYKVLADILGEAKQTVKLEGNGLMIVTKDEQDKQAEQAFLNDSY